MPVHSVTERYGNLRQGHLIMISGDNQKVAEAVSQSEGLTEARGDLMPEQEITNFMQQAEREIALARMSWTTTGSSSRPGGSTARHARAR